MISIPKISKALRDNGLEQIRGQYIRFDSVTGKPVAACAIGQVEVNLGVDRLAINMALGSITGYMIESCPVCGIEASWYSMIIHLNDSHFWTFEKIADWMDEESIYGDVGA